MRISPECVCDFAGIRTGPGDGFDPAIGSYFQIFFPEDWPVEERYDFIWHELPEEEKRFNKYPYAK